MKMKVPGAEGGSLTSHDYFIRLALKHLKTDPLAATDCYYLDCFFFFPILMTRFGDLEIENFTINCACS